MTRMLSLLLPAGLLLAVAAPPAMAGEPPTQALEPVRVVERAAPVRLVFDCDRRVLPRQRLVAETLDLHNLSQVYDARARLMAEVGRACQRPGAERVGLVRAGDAPRAAPADRRVVHRMLLPNQGLLVAVDASGYSPVTHPQAGPTRVRSGRDPCAGGRPPAAAGRAVAAVVCTSP